MLCRNRRAPAGAAVLVVDAAVDVAVVGRGDQLRGRVAGNGRATSRCTWAGAPGPAPSAARVRSMRMKLRSKTLRQSGARNAARRIVARAS